MNKITEQELAEIIQLNNDVNQVVNHLGYITIEINRLEALLSQSKESRDHYMSTYGVLEERSKEINNRLSSKYGQISIDLETGQIN